MCTAYSDEILVSTLFNEEIDSLISWGRTIFHTLSPVQVDSLSFLPGWYFKYGKIRHKLTMFERLAVF